MIHVSLDRDKESAQQWAAGAKLPWFTILPKDVAKSKLNEFKKTRFVPEYNLIDKDGKILASGAAACFTKIKALSK